MSLENDSRQMYTEVGPEISSAPVPFSQKRGRGYHQYKKGPHILYAVLSHSVLQSTVLTSADDSGFQIKGNFQD